MLASGQGWAVSRAGLSIQRSNIEQCMGCVEWMSAGMAQAQRILAEVIGITAQLSSAGHRDMLPMRPHLLQSSGAKPGARLGLEMMPKDINLTARVLYEVDSPHISQTGSLRYCCFQ